jgi:hypothetical protein
MNKNTSYALTALFALGLGALGFFLGRQSGDPLPKIIVTGQPGSGEQSQSDSEYLEEIDSLNAKIDSLNEALSDLRLQHQRQFQGANLNVQTHEQISDETTHQPRQPPDDLVAALSSDDLINRWGGFIDAVRAMNSQNVDQVVAAFNTLPPGYERNMEMRLLMKKWATFDPESALSYANELASTESRLAITEVMTAWSENDPDGAIAWFQENLDEEEANRKGYLPGVISGVASRDPARANELLKSIKDRNARWQASSLLVQRYIDQSPEEAMKWAGALPTDDPNFRNGILGQVASAVAKRGNLQSCARWAESLEAGESRNRVVSSLITQWSTLNPAEAAKWAGSLEDAPTRIHGMTQVVNYWAFKDPESTANWLENYPRTAETDPVVQTFVNRMTSRNPGRAATVANEIFDANQRTAAVRQVHKTWNRLNASAAEAWRVANAPHIPSGGG